MDLLPRRYLVLRRLFVVVFLNSIISVCHRLPAAPCSANTFFCHSNMCINNSLVCNGVQNCVYPWDENHCKGKHLSFAEAFTVGYFGLLAAFAFCFFTPAATCSLLFFSFTPILFPRREAIEEPFPSDHEDPRYCHWCLFRHSPCSSYYFHPGPDEAAKEKGNLALAVDFPSFCCCYQEMRIVSQWRPRFEAPT